MCGQSQRPRRSGPEQQPRQNPERLLRPLLCPPRLPLLSTTTKWSMPRSTVNYRPTWTAQRRTRRNLPETRDWKARTIPQQHPRQKERRLQRKRHRVGSHRTTPRLTTQCSIRLLRSPTMNQLMQNLRHLRPRCPPRPNPRSSPFPRRAGSLRCARCPSRSRRPKSPSLNTKLSHKWRWSPKLSIQKLQGSLAPQRTSTTMTLRLRCSMTPRKCTNRALLLSFSTKRPHQREAEDGRKSQRRHEPQHPASSHACQPPLCPSRRGHPWLRPSQAALQSRRRQRAPLLRPQASPVPPRHQALCHPLQHRSPCRFHRYQHPANSRPRPPHHRQSRRRCLRLSHHSLQTPRTSLPRRDQRRGLS